MALGVNVVLHQQIIFVVVGFLSKKKVATLEPRLEEQSAISRAIIKFRNQGLSILSNFKHTSGPHFVDFTFSAQ